MLSAKYTRIHGMHNERWTTREKILQYRSILKLHARDKKLQAINGAKFKQKNHRDLKELTKDTNSYREILKDVMYGDKRILRSTLQTEKDFKVVLKDAVPVEAYRAVFQDYNFNRKQLDKLQYLKRKKRKDYCFWQSEYARLSDALKHKDEITESEEQQLTRQQQLFARYQVAVAKRAAAKAISDTYQDLLDILRKDSKYFDGVLNTLRMDRRDQCRVIYKTTLMGQLATENLDDIRQKYKAMARDVWINMKEREQDLEIARERAEDVWEYAKSLVRIESDPNLAEKKKDSTAMEARLQRQIQNLEKIFDKMKDTMLIRSYEELFSRLEDQMKQRERLSKLHSRTLKERNFILNKKNHAEMMLQNLEYSVISTTTKYKSDKKNMFEKIEEEKKRIEDTNEMIVSRGELLTNIRAALQSMASMMVCVNPATAKPFGKAKDTRKSKREAEEAAKDAEEATTASSTDEDDKSKKVCGEPIENEGLAVLLQVSKKARALFMMTDFPLTEAKEKKAVNDYADYITLSRAQVKFTNGDVEQSGMYFEHEALDPTVPTRTEIKMKSKQLVEAHASKDD